MTADPLGADNHSPDYCRALFENVNAAVFVIELRRDEAGQVVDACLVDANPACLHLFGLDRKALGQTVSALPWPPEQTAAILSDAAGIAAGERRSREWLFPEIGRQVEIVSTPIGTDHILFTAYDLTDCRQPTESAHSSNPDDHYQWIAESVADFSFGGVLHFATGSFEYKWLYGSVEEVTGYTPQEIEAFFGQGMMVYLEKFVHPDDLPLAFEYFQQVMAGLGRKGFECRTIHKDGQVKYVRTYHHVVSWDNEAQTCMIVGVILDITETRQAETSYRAVFDASNDAMFLLDAESGRIVDANQQAARLLGLTRAGLIERSPDDPDLATFFGPDWSAWVQSAAQGVDLEVEWSPRDRQGFQYWAEVRLKRANINGLDRVLAVVRDITTHKLDHHALQESEERYRRVAEAVADFALSVARQEDDEWTLEWLTGEGRSFLGLGRDELEAGLGRGIGLHIARFVHPEDRELARRSLERVMEQGAQSDLIEYRAIASDGRVVWLQVHVQAERSSPQDAPHRCVIVVRDITRRKELERTLARQNQHLAALRAVAIALNGLLETPLVLETILLQSAALLPAEVQEIWRFDPQRGELRPAAWMGFQPHDTGPSAGGNVLAGCTARGGQSCAIPDARQDSRLMSDPLLAKAGIESGYSIPLLSRGQPVGVWNIFSRTPCRFTPDWVEMASGLALYAARALETG